MMPTLHRKYAVLLVVVGAVTMGDEFGYGQHVGNPGWMMRSHDVRRTGRALNNGPRRGSSVWTYTAVDGVVINIEPAATREGVFFGTWGLMRQHGANREDWDKFDGRIYGLDAMTGRELWSPLHPGRTPYAYAYKGREPGKQDGPAGPGRFWNYYNGTVEGTPAVDPKDGTLYIGRGDGCLYAVDPSSSKVRWKFRTFDPKRADDPEGGGEIVGGPLVDERGTIVFATFAAPHRPKPPDLVRHETNAVYAVSRQGKMLWRYPREGTVEAVFVAPPALSPDGTRVYAVTGLPDAKFPCELLALSLREGKRIWRMDLGQTGGQDMAVGIDGTVYVVGSQNGPLGSTPAAFAIRDGGESARMLWGPVMLEGMRPPTHFAGGVALYERGGRVEHVYASTTMLRDLNGHGGKLHRLDPETGKVTHTWDPEKAQPACVGTLTDVSLDDEGVIYVGVRGRLRIFNKPAIPGRMYALRLAADGFEVLWAHEITGQIDWASPAIGPAGGLYFGSSAAFNPLDFIRMHDPGENVQDADPMFYGVKD